MYHSGRKVTIPQSGRDTLRVSVPTSTFLRHDRVNGKRYTRPAVVEFDELGLARACSLLGGSDAFGVTRLGCCISLFARHHVRTDRGKASRL